MEKPQGMGGIQNGTVSRLKKNLASINDAPSGTMDADAELPKASTAETAADDANEVGERVVSPEAMQLPASATVVAPATKATAAKILVSAFIYLTPFPG